jgi:hypothetical protein
VDFDAIMTPSEKVIIAMIQKHWWLFNKLENPSKNIIKAFITKHRDKEIIEKYRDIFTNSDWNDMIREAPILLSFSPQPSQEICWSAIRQNPKMIVYVKHQTREMCRFVVSNEAWYCKWGLDGKSEGIIESLQYIDEDIVQLIVANVNLLPYWYKLPTQYITKDIAIKGVQNNFTSLEKLPEQFIGNMDINNAAFEKTVRSIQYIPTKYQTNDMKTKAAYEGYIKFLQQTQELSDLAWNSRNSYYGNILNDIKPEFHREEWCLSEVKRNPEKLLICGIINETILETVFKSQPTIPRKDRFKFINYATELHLVKIVSIRSQLLRELSDEKQTDAVIKAALQKNGYSIQYVKNKTNEYCALALETTPDAMRYVK